MFTRTYTTAQGCLQRTMRASQNAAVIRVYDEAGNVIEMHEHEGNFKEPQIAGRRSSEFGIIE